MGFLKNIFFRKGTNTKEKEEANSLKKTGKVKKQSTSSKDNRKSKTGESTSHQLDEKSANVRHVEAFLECLNKALEEDAIMEFFASEKPCFIPEDGHKGFTARETAQNLCRMHRSFPDLRFAYQSITDAKTPNKVVVDGIFVSGTHTAEPYTFLPGVFPPVPTSGIRAENDEEMSYFKLKDGKIDV